MQYEYLATECRECSYCKAATSFERENEKQPPEGNTCKSCGDWFCDKCIDWSIGNSDCTCKACAEQERINHVTS